MSEDTLHHVIRWNLPKPVSEAMIVAHNTGSGSWPPPTPDGTQEGPTFKASGDDGRCFVIVAIRVPKVQSLSG
jgi:hypothetical protein